MAPQNPKRLLHRHRRDHRAFVRFASIRAPTFHHGQSGMEQPHLQPLIAVVERALPGCRKRRIALAYLVKGRKGHADPLGRQPDVAGLAQMLDERVALALGKLAGRPFRLDQQSPLSALHHQIHRHLQKQTGRCAPPHRKGHRPDSQFFMM
jgi:hypothetical protein